MVYILVKIRDTYSLKGKYKYFSDEVHVSLGSEQLVKVSAQRQV